MQVELFKKNGSYIDQTTNEERQTTRFYIKCGETLVPIEPVYFKNKDTGKDNQYGARKSVMSAFAAILPDKPDNGGRVHKPAQSTPPDEDVPAPSDDDLPI